jgi:hypothetical protein
MITLHICGSPVINGKEPKHEGRQVHKGEKKGLFLRAFYLRDLCVHKVG